MLIKCAVASHLVSILCYTGGICCVRFRLRSYTLHQPRNRKTSHKGEWLTVDNFIIY